MVVLTIFLFTWSFLWLISRLMLFYCERKHCIMTDTIERMGCWSELVAVSLFVWLWLIVNHRKFPVRIVFFSHSNQSVVLLHEPATIWTGQPNGLRVVTSELDPRSATPTDLGDQLVKTCAPWPGTFTEKKVGFKTTLPFCFPLMSISGRLVCKIN